MGPATLNRPLSDEEMEELERQSAGSTGGFDAFTPPADRPLSDAELDAVEMRDGAGTMLQQTPFGQATDPTAPQPVMPERPLSDDEMDELADDTVRDPSYVPTFNEWNEWDQKRAQRSSNVEGFLRGAGSIAQALGSVAYSVAATPGNFVMRGFGPAYDTLVHSSAEGMRRAGVGIAEMITWAGDTAADIRTSTEREAALDGQLRRQMAEQNAFTGNAQADAQIFAQAKEKARSEGFYDLTQGQKSEDRREEYDRFVRGRALEQEFLGIGNFTMGNDPIPTGNLFGPKFVGGHPSQVTAEATTKKDYGIDDTKVDEGIATGVMIAGDPSGWLPLGAGALNKVKALRRLAVIADKPMGWTAGKLGRVARLAEDIEAKALSAGLTTDRMARASGAVAIGAGAIGISQNNDLAKGIAAAATILPAVKYSGKILRRAEGAALAGQMVVKEMGVGGVGVMRADSAARLAENAAIPGRYRSAMQGFFTGPESSLKRASQNEALPLSARQTMARLDRAGATQAFRVADDAVSGALAGTVVGAPFAAIAPEDKQAEIFGSIATMGALGGAVSGPLARRAQMADADVARMLADVEAVGGDAATLAQLPHDKLVRLAAMQGVVSSKVDFVPLRADEYAANDVLNAKNATTTKGLYIDAEDGNRPRIFINIDQLAAGDVGGHEIGHAILKSDILGGEIKNNMRNLVNVQYGQDGVVARGREYATKLLADQVEQGVTGIKPEVLTDAEMQRVARGAKPEDIIRERWQDPAMRERMINERIDEMNQRDMANGGMEFDWARDEIAAETFSGLSGGIDFRNIRQSGPMAAALGAFSGTLDMMGARFRGNGRLETPNRLFEENPLMDTPQMRKAVTDYTKAFDRYLAGMERESAPKPRGTKVAPTGKASEAARSAHNRVYQNGNVTENDIFVVDANGNQIPKSQQQIDTQERARAATLKSINKRDRLVPTHSNEWGARKVGNRTEVGGPNLPMQFDHFVQVPEWLRTKAREFEAGRRNGQSYRISYNAIGTGVSGSYKIKNLGNVEAITREIVPYGWQLSDKNHLLAKAIDLDAFRAATIRAVDRGELPEFGNNVKQVEADLKALLKNYEDGLPGETNLGVLKKNILNGLLGTGTAVQKAANPLYGDLNPKGSVRTFRFDRLNYADPYATGYFPHYHKINTNALPREAGVMSLDEWRQFDADRKSVWLNNRAREAGFTNGENWRNADPAGFRAADGQYRNEFPMPAQGGAAALPGDATSRAIAQDVADADAVGLRSANFLEQAVGDGMENLRAKQAKREGTGVAKNKFVRFHDAQGRPIYIGALKKDGGKSFSAWIEETEAWQSPQETAAYRQWYRELKGYFTQIFGERAGEMMMAWLAAQQNVSPGGALGNVFKVEDRLAGIGTGKKGGLADAKIEGVLLSQVPEGGFGPKLTDFVDAGFLREFRTYMASQPEGGRPFVADVHTGRDSGHVDQQTLTRLKERSDNGDLFIDGKPARVKVTQTKTVKQGNKTVIVPERVRVIPQGSKGFDVSVDMRGSPGGPKYEGISEWGNAMTDHLNNIGWRGGEWTPAEVQAVGWMRVLRQYGLPEPTVLSALQQNTSRVFAEVNYSSGNLLPANYPAFDTLSPDVQRAITTDVITQTVNELAPMIGGSLRVQRVTAGTGVWGNTKSPTTVVEVLGSAEATDIFGLALATASEQAATMSTVLGVGGKDSRVLMFKKAGGGKFSEAEMQSLIDDAGVSGYTLQQLPDGDTGIIADSTKDFKPKGFTEKKIADVKKKLVDWAEKSGVDIDVEIASARVNSYANNWNNAKDGQSYLSGIVQRGGSSKIRDIVRFRGRYAEILREAYERHAPEAVVATPQEQIGPIRQAAEAPPMEILEMLRGA